MKVIRSNSTDKSKVMLGLQAGCAYARFSSDPLGTLLQASKTWGAVSAFGDIFHSRKRDLFRVIALGPEFNQQVLGNPEIFHATKLTVPGPKLSAHSRLRLGLTALNGRNHSIERRLAIPLYGKQAIDAYHERFITLIDKTLCRWPLGETVDMWREMKNLVLNISTDYLFGSRNADRGYQLGSLLHKWLTSGLNHRITLFPYDLPLTPFRRLLAFAETVEDDMEELIHEILLSNSGASENFVDWIKKHHLVPNERTPLTGQLATLFLASEETLVNALTWTLFLLAQHPRVMADLLCEIGSVLHRDPPRKEQLDQLPFLDAAIKESMRLLPPVPFTIRKATCDVQLGGMFMQDKHKVYLCHFFTHHLSELYPDPEVFRPERWFSIKPGPYEYLPFSAGPRFCIGYNYATALMKVSLAMILQRFRLTVVPHSRIDRLVQVTMRPKFGMPMVLHRQDRQFQAVPVHGNIHEMVRLTEGS